MAARVTSILDNVVTILQTVIASNSVTVQGESYTFVHTLSTTGLVRRGGDIQKAPKDKIAVRVMRDIRETSQAGALIGGAQNRILVEIHGRIPTQGADTGSEREDAAADLEADMIAALMNDQGLAAGSSDVVEAITMRSVAGQGGYDASPHGAVAIVLEATWHSMVGN